jgi:hypothetical protein
MEVKGKISFDHGIQNIVQVAFAKTPGQDFPETNKTDQNTVLEIHSNLIRYRIFTSSLHGHSSGQLPGAIQPC